MPHLQKLLMIVNCVDKCHNYFFIDTFYFLLKCHINFFIDTFYFFIDTFYAMLRPKINLKCHIYFFIQRRSDRQQCGCQGLKALIKPILEFLVQQNSSFWFLFQLYGVETVFKGAHFWKQFILKNASKQKAFNDSMTSSSYTSALQGGISAVQI